MNAAGNNLLTAEAIVGYLDEDIQFLPVTVLSSVDSTNDWCRRGLRDGAAPSFLCVAEEQTAGKGRRGRQWLAGEGGDIIMSYARHFAVPLQQLGCVSLATGVAVKAALQNLGVADAELKWPNDVLVQGGKIAGVLVESVVSGAKGVVLIIGIGINITPRRVPGVETACVHDHVNAPIDRNRLIAAVLNQLETMLNQLLVTPQEFHEQIQQHFHRQAPVRVLLEDGSSLEGIMSGINSSGELRVQVDGEVREFNSADISLGVNA